MRRVSRQSRELLQLFGRRVRALRKARNRTQEQLGADAGLSGKFIGQIERGTANPSLDAIARLAAALDLEAWELLRVEEERPRGQYSRSGAASLARDRIRNFLEDRSTSDIDRAMRILEAAFGDLTGPR